VSAARARCTGSASRRSATARRPLRSGGRAERRALWWYRLRGWKILGANVWAGGNELDLIARRGRELRFVEVKEKRGAGFGDPLEMVTAEKQRRVRRAAAAWLAAKPELRGLRVGFDVVAVRAGRCERVEDAFE
jgi:putative endonuclease